MQRHYPFLHLARPKVLRPTVIGVPAAVKEVPIKEEDKNVEQIPTIGGGCCTQ